MWRALKICYPPYYPQSHNCIFYGSAAYRTFFYGRTRFQKSRALKLPTQLRDCIEMETKIKILFSKVWMQSFNLPLKRILTYAYIELWPFKGSHGCAG